MNKADSSLDPPHVYAFPTRRPWLVMILAIGVALLSILLIRTIPMDGSLASMLPEHDSSSYAMGRIAESFELANNVTLFVQAPSEQADPGDDLIAFAERFDSAFQALEIEADHACEVSWVWPRDAEGWMRDVVLPNMLLYLDQDGQRLLRDRLSPEGMAEQLRRNERLAASPGLAGSAMSKLLEDPLGLRELLQTPDAFAADAASGRPGEPMLSPDGRSLLIHITPIELTHDSAQANAVIDAVQHAIDKAEPGSLRVSTSGGLAIAAAAERSIRGDMIVSSIATVVFLQLLFLATYRRLVLFPIAFVPAVLGILVGFAVFALTGRALSPPTAVLGALLAGLGIDYAIHYLAHSGSGEPLPVVSRRVARPLGIACGTSIIAFLTLVTSDVAALRDFASIGAIGLGATLITTLIILPAMLRLIAYQTDPDRFDLATPRWRIDRLILTSIRHQRFGVPAIVALALAAGTVLLLHPAGPVAYDSDLGNMHPQPNAPLKTQHGIAEAFPGQGETLMLYLTAPTEQALIDRASRSALALSSTPTTQRLVSGTIGLHTLIPTASQRKQRLAFGESFDVERVRQDFDRAVQASPFDPAAFVSYREALGELLRPGEGPSTEKLRAYPGLAAGLLPSSTGQVSDEEPVFQVVSIVNINTLPQTRAERGELIDALRDALVDVPGVTLTGMTVVGHDIERQVRGELPSLLLIAMGALVVWLGMCYRNAIDLACALLPAVLGLLITFALMRVMGVGLNLLNLIALPLLIGLGIDDGVLMVSIARDGRKRHSDRGTLIQNLSHSAQAVTLTSVSTVFAFGSLTLTAVPAIRGLGAVLAMGILACWAVTIVLLAPLLVHLARTAPPPPSIKRPGS